MLCWAKFHYTATKSGKVAHVWDSKISRERPAPPSKGVRTKEMANPVTFVNAHSATALYVI